MTLHDDDQTYDLTGSLLEDRGHLLECLKLVLFAVTDDADNNDGKVDRLAIVEAIKIALDKVDGE